MINKKEIAFVLLGNLGNDGLEYNEIVDVLKEALIIHGVIPQLNTVGIDKDIGKSIDKLEKSDKFKRPTKKRF
jgi:hypothetical protein